MPGSLHEEVQSTKALRDSARPVRADFREGAYTFGSHAGIEAYVSNHYYPSPTLFSDELQYHSLSCPQTNWRSPTDSSLQAMTSRIPSNSSLSDVMAATPAESIIPSFLTQDSLASTSLPLPPQEDHQAFVDFLSCLSSPPTVEEIPAVFEPFHQLGDMLATTTNNIKNLTTPSPPTPVHSIQPNRTRLYPRRSIQPYNVLNKRKKLKDKPIYTRKQVDDMLSAVSSCFAGTMKIVDCLQEEVLKRVDASAIKSGEKTSEPAKDTTTTTTVPDNSNRELRQILSDTLPRLFNGLQNFLEERTKAD
ncbi:hypothetical protein H0H93_010356 [Arthromyces matolae]|nr:hypothetical protein H0H93_010356 [Arthromyces matolae]